MGAFLRSTRHALTPLFDYDHTAFLADLVEKFLGMRPDLGTVSCPYELGDLVPVLSKYAQAYRKFEFKILVGKLTVNKLLMFLSGPSSSESATFMLGPELLVLKFQILGVDKALDVLFRDPGLFAVKAITIVLAGSAGFFLLCLFDGVVLGCFWNIHFLSLNILESICCSFSNNNILRLAATIFDGILCFNRQGGRLSHRSFVTRRKLGFRYCEFFIIFVVLVDVARMSTDLDQAHILKHRPSI